jgi:hypothetical protein
MAAKEILVCTKCAVSVPLDSPTNTVPRYTGKIGDDPGTRKEIPGQDDLRDFKKKHRGKRHRLLKVRDEAYNN